MGLISFQLFKAFINRGKSQSCQSIFPLTRSAFTSSWSCPCFDLSVLVCSKDQINGQNRFLVVIICGYALQMRKLSYDFCAFWVFQCQQLFAVDFVYFGFQGEFTINASEGKSASDDLDGGQKEGFSYKDYSNIHEKITLV